MLQVTSGIIEKNEKILIARRKAGKQLAGFWEFPGGKLEENETPEECLKREIKEELGIEIRVKAHFMDSIFHYPEKSVCLLVFKADYLSGKIILTDHDKVEWVVLNELGQYEFAPADKSIVAAITSI
jgi:8-oxo-dGTP diphosphatase